MASGRAQVNVTDSLALDALINSTNIEEVEPSWGNGPVSSWYGAIVREGRVVQLLLQVTGLTGTLPDEIGDLTALEHLSLGGRRLAGEC